MLVASCSWRLLHQCCAGCGVLDCQRYVLKAPVHACCFHAYSWYLLSHTQQLLSLSLSYSLTIPQIFLSLEWFFWYGEDVFSKLWSQGWQLQSFLSSVIHAISLAPKASYAHTFSSVWEVASLMQQLHQVFLLQKNQDIRNTSSWCLWSKEFLEIFRIGSVCVSLKCGVKQAKEI